MKALSIRQPWASLIILGFKQVETRSYLTHFRGPLAIHASRKFGPPERHAAQTAVMLPLLRAGHIDEEAPPLGVVLGTVELVDCLPVEELGALIDPRTPRGARERMLGNYDAGRFGWLLERPCVWAEPIPATGALSFWHFDPGPRRK